jgi:hypothetical protein
MRATALSAISPSSSSQRYRLRSALKLAAAVPGRCWHVGEERLSILAAGVKQAPAADGEEGLELANAGQIADQGVLRAVLSAEVPLEGGDHVPAVPRFLWGLRVLRRVLRDLEAHPQRGFVAGRVYRVGRTLVAVQYWESFDALDAWARDHRLPHRRPWQQYLREALDDGAMGLWHETYLASPGSWEGVYLNMPPWGLAAGVEAVEMQATKGSARERLREQRKRASRAAAEKTPPPPP